MADDAKPFTLMRCLYVVSGYVSLLFFMVVIEPVGHIYSLATDSSK
jgi:hypothetical protein